MRSLPDFLEGLGIGVVVGIALAALAVRHLL